MFTIRHPSTKINVRTLVDSHASHRHVPRTAWGFDHLSGRDLAAIFGAGFWSDPCTWDGFGAGIISLVACGTGNIGVCGGALIAIWKAVKLDTVFNQPHCAPNRGGAQGMDAMYLLIALLRYRLLHECRQAVRDTSWRKLKFMTLVLAPAFGLS